MKTTHNYFGSGIVIKEQISEDNGSHMLYVQFSSEKIWCEFKDISFDKKTNAQ